RKTAQPFAAIDQRLRDVAQTPYGQSVQLERIQESGVAAAGWNRLVDQINATPDESDEEDSIDRKLAEALNRRRGSQSLEVLQALRDGIAVTDPRGRIEFANAAIASLLDLESCDSLTDEALCSALAASTKGADAFAASCPTTPVVAEVEASCESEDNARTLRVERQPLDGSEGRSVWSIRDITQQKLAEKSRDQFIDAATHELRTPLANIKAYAETLATCEVDDPEQQKEFFNTINSEATRLGRFVDDLLDISSMEVGSLTIRRQNVEVERLLRESADKIKPLVEKKLQQFEVVLPPKLGEMHLDKDKLSAMVVNLLGNASKYTPEGGTVRLKAELGEDALTVIVSDTGVGISPEELPRVFEKFFRSEDPRVRNETGTGLGLSLAREIARLHGGDIHAVSTVGEGSSFVITLPRTERDAV
ncbi:MAG: ATP-binding protein, partial [Planctomycetota bacterium]